MTDEPTSSSPGEELRRRRRRRTQSEIEVVALRLFAERGFKDVTVDEIAAASNISNRTFFRYFASKDALLHGNPEHRMARLRRALSARPADEPVHLSLRHGLHALAESYEEDREVVLLRARSFERTPEVFAAAALVTLESMEWVTDWVADRMRTDTVADVRPRIIAWTTMAAFQAALRAWFARGAVDNLPALLAQSFVVQDELAASQERRTGAG